MNEGGSPTPANPPVYGPSPPPGENVQNVVGENTVQDGGSKVIQNDGSEKTSKEFPKRLSYGKVPLPFSLLKGFLKGKWENGKGGK